MDGVLLRAKPAGVTSHDVVAEVRRSLPRGTKVGHAGTLDPFATGLLLVLVGRATRAQRFLMALPKTYRAVARLGWTSDTGDRDGELVHTGRVPEQLEIPTGERLQTPPVYSAVKVGGRRAYELARAGELPELTARPVTIHRAELVSHDDERAQFEIECSSGTYVRSLVTDLGDAYCEELERTAIGPFRLEDADPERLVPLGDALTFLPERVLAADEARAVSHGRAVAAAADSNEQNSAEHVRLTFDGELVHTGRMPERLEIPMGEQLQTPPAYSAVKVGGRRAYELARGGEEPELTARPVTIHRAELLSHDDDRATFEIECSSGTYVRSLVTDLGDAYCEELERTAIGPFRLEDADPDRLVPLRDALAFLPERLLSAEEALAVSHGRSVPAGPADGEHVRLTFEGELLAIAEPRAAELKPVVVFAPA